MTRRFMKGWYLVNVNKPNSCNYVVNSIDGYHVRGAFEGYGEAITVTCLTWGRIHRLTGCVIPIGCDEGDFAVGDLKFCKANRCFIMTGVDD